MAKRRLGTSGRASYPPPRTPPAEEDGSCMDAVMEDGICGGGSGATAGGLRIRRGSWPCCAALMLGLAYFEMRSSTSFFLCSSCSSEASPTTELTPMMPPGRWNGSVWLRITSKLE